MAMKRGQRRPHLPRTSRHSCPHLLRDTKNLEWPMRGLAAPGLWIDTVGGGTQAMEGTRPRGMKCLISG